MDTERRYNMLSRNKPVSFRVYFDTKGNIVGVEGPDGKKCKGVSLSQNPIHGVMGVATIVVTKEDDPCIIQGGVKWCWG